MMMDGATAQGEGREGAAAAAAAGDSAGTKKDGEVITVVAVDKGLGLAKARLLRTLASQGKEGQRAIEVVEVEVPEPTEPDDVKAAAEIVAKALDSAVEKKGGSDEGKTHIVLIASSRGGKVAAHLLTTRRWTGPTLLLSAMSTVQCCSVEGVAILMAHGTRDGTNPIHRVREDAQLGTPGLIALREFDDEHSLRSVEEGGVLEELINQVVTTAGKAKELLAAQLQQRQAAQPPKRSPFGGGGAGGGGGARIALFGEIASRRKND